MQADCGGMSEGEQPRASGGLSPKEAAEEAEETEEAQAGMSRSKKRRLRYQHKKEAIKAHSTCMSSNDHGNHRQAHIRTSDCGCNGMSSLLIRIHIYRCRVLLSAPPLLT